MRRFFRRETATHDTSPRKYDTLSLCAYSVVLAGAWSYAAATFGTSIYAGGIPALIYGADGVSILESLFLVSIAEFGSAFPSGSGIPHYSRKLSTLRWGRRAEYIVGALHTMGVCFSPSGAVIGTIQLFATTGAVMHPDWVPQRWQILLAFQVANILVVAFMLYANKGLAVLNRVAGIIIFVSLFIVMGILLGSGGEMATNRAVWVEIRNETGFSSDSYSILLGICIALYAYGPPHWLCSLSDDVENPRRALPIAFCAQQIGNFLTVFLFLLTAGYAVTDYSDLVDTHYPSAIGALFQQSLGGSKGGTVALLLLMCIPTAVGLLSYYNVCMMVAYGFLRTKPVPKWEWLTHRNNGTGDPLRILYVLAGINCALGFIYLGSEQGFSILLGAPGVLYFTGYLVPLFAHVVNRGHTLGTGGWFRLPRRVSVTIATINLFAISFINVLLCLPRSGPVTVRNFNWGVLFLIVGICGATLSWHFYGQYRYEGIENDHEIIESTTIDDVVECGTVKADDKCALSKI